MKSHWRDYQNEEPLEFEYCLYGIFYQRHQHRDIASGKCLCKREDALLTGLTNYAVQCIRVRRSEKDGGKLAFWFGQRIGHRSDPYGGEYGLQLK